MLCFTLLLGMVGTESRILALGAASAETKTSAEQTTILVQFEPGLPPQARDSSIAQMGGELITWLPAINTAQIRLDQNEPVAAAQMLIATNEAIVFAEADGSVAAATLPTDPDITDQRKVYAPEMLNFFAGWEYTTGDPAIVIAVLDSGIATDHPEFTGQLLPGYDFVQRDSDPQDENGHGTHVAGIAGARIDNGIGVAGVCGRCLLLPVRVLNAQNIGSWTNVAQGVIYAVEHGARVIVMSLGSTVYSQTMKNALDYAQAQGVLVVAAAGNTNSAEPFYPAAFSSVIGVGAITRQEQRWPFSNYGENADVVAPGDAIYSTYFNPSQGTFGYQVLTGTSMAAPFVAGLAGLLLAQTPTRTITDVTRIITNTAVDLGAPGRDHHFGYGHIDVNAALASGAASPRPAAGLTGTVWKDQNLNGQLDPATEQGLADVVIQVQDEQNQRTGLAVTGPTGVWRVSGLPTGAYTLHVTSTVAAELMAGPDIRVVLTAPVTIKDLNFGFLPLPTADSIAGFAIVRANRSVTLTWAIAHPLVQAVTVQRALSENGDYTAILTRAITAAEIATRQPITWSEQLPMELGQVNVYYRLVLAPSGVVWGPKEAWPISGSSARMIFIPLILGTPAVGL